MDRPFKILAVIPARGGSKRIPGKNKRLLGDKPLIAWSIEFAKGLHDICDILVTTDDSDIAKISQNYGVLVPWMRPKELSGDFASSVDVAIHALDWYEKKFGPVDGLLLLQPTSPFRSKEIIINGINDFKNNNLLPVISVNEIKVGSKWVVMPKDNGIVENTYEINNPDLDNPIYAVNGSFYLISPNKLRKEKCFSGTGKFKTLIMNSQKDSIDIDTEYDWKCAIAALL